MSAAQETFRVGFWNTWLLAPRLWNGGPRIPGGERLFFAPDVDARAPLVGRALAGRFDAMALSEVFEASEQQAVADGWPGADLFAGPGRGRFRTTASGLVTLVDPQRCSVQDVRRHAYCAGGDIRDSDTFATKGAMLTSIRVGPAGPVVDLVSTHLFAGGDLLPIPGAEDEARHHRARMGQVDELVRFVDDAHDPDHVLLVVGDFNVPARMPGSGDPTGRYRDLAERLGSLGLVDVWADHGIGEGHTCSFDGVDRLDPDPDEPDAVRDRSATGTTTDDADDAVAEVEPGERIDYLWLKVPETVDATVERPRRWAFPDRGVKGGPAGTLSDHLALTVTLHLAHR